MNTTTRTLALAGAMTAITVCHGPLAAEGLPDPATGDGLGVYQDDLSGYHVPVRPRLPRPATAVEAPARWPDRAALRAMFHRPVFNRIDGLAAYGNDPAWRAYFGDVDVAAGAPARRR